MPYPKPKKAKRTYRAEGLSINRPSYPISSKSTPSYYSLWGDALGDALTIPFYIVFALVCCALHFTGELIAWVINRNV